MKIIVTVLLVAGLAGSLSGQKAAISEEYVSLPTYPFSDPDPVAKPGKIYPYFRFDGYANTAVEKKHKMVVMENNWIKVWIAPDMGGKVYGALDKNTGKYFIYYNNVVKFREIAMRGPWTSGGIEFNFGSIGHAPTTATPVDYHFQNNNDGSVSCFLGSLELTSRTEWRVEVRLPADKAWFEINSYWNNPTNEKTSLYHWQTAAADASEDLRYYFPGNAYIDHSGNAFEWPVMPDGRDISLYRENNYGTYHSYHVLGDYTDWFAGYYKNSETGFGHWSRYPYKPGKKIWIWGLSRQGEIWRGLLTDSTRGNKQYTEIQTGLLFNQEADESTMSPFKHLYLMPGAVENFSEKWFPIGNTGGVASISQEGILNIERNEKGFRLLFQSLGYVNDILQITDSLGKILFEDKINMAPQEIFSKQLEFNPGNILIRLKNGELFTQPGNNEITKFDRPLKSEPAFNWESVYGLYTRGIEKSRQRLYAEATIFLNKCILKDTDYLPAYTALAEIDYREMRFKDAEKKLLKVLSFDTYDPDANYLYAKILVQKKEFNKARDAFGVTLRSTAYKSASLNQLALIALREKRYEEATEYVTNAGSFNGMDLNIYKTAIVIARLSGNQENYKRLLNRLISIDPLSHFGEFENYYSTKDSVQLKNFISGFNTELKYEAFIELALWYFDAGLEEEAWNVMLLSPEHPLADFLSAYLAFRKKDEQKTKFYFERALKADDKFVFPFRKEYADILKWAEQKEFNWKTKYYSALFYWGISDTEKAAKYFSECGDLPDSYSFYLTRAGFVKKNGGNEEEDYIKASKKGPDEWRPYHLLHGYYLNSLNYSKALAISLKAMKVFPKSYIIRFDYAQSLLTTGKYEDCIQLLKKTEILPYEGAGYSRITWRQANLLEGIRLINAGKLKEAGLKIASARTWPENLGVGRPYLVDETYEDLLDVVCNKRQEKRIDTENYKRLIAQLPEQKTEKPQSSDPESLIIEGIRKLVEEPGNLK
jgi:hypothetical protein